MEAVLLARLWRSLSERRKRQFGLLTALVLVSAFTEVVSLGAVLPFLGILTAPERAFRHPVVARLADLLGITVPEKLVLPLSLCFIAAVLAAGGVRMLLLWATTRLTSSVGSDLGLDVYRRTLYQPYQVHLARNSSEVLTGITNKISVVVYGVVMPLQTLAISVVMIFAIMATLMVIDPAVALAATLGFGCSYFLITQIARNRLARNSADIAREETQVVKALQEGLGGIRDVLLDGTQPTYCNIFRKADLPLRRAHAHNSLTGQSPRYIMEALGMVLIAMLAYGLTLKPGGVAASLPVLGALALGAQRLLPALQQGYNAWVSIAGSQASLADTLDLLEQPLPPEAFLPPPEPLPFRNEVAFEQVRFRYSEDGPWVLDGLDLSIPKGARIGLVGSTGSGKSTTLDLLMGLLAPTEGRLLVDGQPLVGPAVRAWQRNLAHVPQAIYLADTTLAENIAFGIEPKAIDLDRVRQVARQAQIAEFIEGRPEGYGALVGERGIRLSGGQRQRIGIARALYKQASVLVFDEATSALDNATEQSVMDAIEGLNRDLTIFLIAHRLTTVMRCDRIVELAHGKVVAQGSYAELLERSPSFRHLSRSVGTPP
ncbi:MAG: ABC transporter ATP-binding protein [Holophagaceae bacterium]|nr:ABC transporter ATP-binding protein [Holophagaceae bacterium]